MFSKSSKQLLLQDNIEAKEVIIQQHSTSRLSAPPGQEEANKETVTEKEEVLPAAENKRTASEAQRKLQAFDFDKYLDVIQQKMNKYKNSTRTDYISAVRAAETLHNALTLANLLRGKTGDESFLSDGKSRHVPEYISH